MKQNIGFSPDFFHQGSTYSSNVAVDQVRCMGTSSDSVDQIGYRFFYCKMLDQINLLIGIRTAEFEATKSHQTIQVFISKTLYFFRWALFLGAILVLVFPNWAVPSQADSIPNYMSGPFVYSSIDMSPVEINFADIEYFSDGTYKAGRVEKSTGNLIDGDFIARAVLPRAYINIFSPYSTQNVTHEEFRRDTLPDRIFGNDLEINYMHPLGTPYTVALTNGGEVKPTEVDSSFGKNFEAQPKSTKLRWLRMDARIIALSSKQHIDGQSGTRDMKCIEPEGCRSLRKGVKFLDMYEGFDHYENMPTTVNSYYNSGTDEIKKSTAMDQRKKLTRTSFAPTLSH